MLYREIIAVCSQIHTKHINTLCGQNVELLNVKLTVHKPTFKPGILLVWSLLCLGTWRPFLFFFIAGDQSVCYFHKVQCLTQIMYRDIFPRHPPPPQSLYCYSVSERKSFWCWVIWREVIRSERGVFVCRQIISVCVYVYIYIYTHTHTHTWIMAHRPTYST